MDTEYLVQTIDQFITVAERRTASTATVYPHADRCRAIAESLRPDLTDAFNPLPIARSNLSPGRNPWSGAISAAAVLRDHILESDRIQRALGPSGPQLSSSSLHEWVWSAAAPHWDAGHHAVAVREAARAVLVHLREKAGYPSMDGFRLINALFSDRGPTLDEPRLRTWRPAGATEETAINLHEGLASLGRGCVRFIRNVTQHHDGELDEVEALEMLATLSLFARHAETCRVEVADTTSDDLER